MSASLAIGLMIAVVIVLLLLRGRSFGTDDRNARVAAARNWSWSGDTLPPAELAARIFSPKDRDFIRLAHSSRLQSLYLAERRRVALYWVQQVSWEVSRIMREHRLRSRQSPDLSVAAETKLSLRYVELKLLCGSLQILIQVFGPHALAELASYAGELYQRIGQSLPESAGSRSIQRSGQLAA